MNISINATLLIASAGSALLAGCGYFTDTIAPAVGPAKPVSEVATLDPPTCGSPRTGAAITGDHGAWRGCTQQATIAAIVEKAAELGYDGITNANCVGPGIIGHEICACSATPYSCE